MAGSDIATAAYTVKKALYDVALQLWPQDQHDMLVSWGTVGTNVPDQYVEFHGVDVGQEPATLSTNRSREETLRLELLWYTTRWGEIDAAREAEDYTVARIRELEEYVRTVDTTLGGVARHCFLTEMNTDDAPINRAGTAQGRLFAARTVFEAKVRITS